MSDDTYYRNELAMTGLDAWITREPDYDEGPPEPEPCCPEFTDMCADENAQGHERCDQCGGCLDCELASRRKVAPVVHAIEDDESEECPF